MQMAWIPSSSPTAREEPWKEAGEQLWIFQGKFGGPRSETAAKCAAVVPDPPFCPCIPLIVPPEHGVLLLFNHCHSADCAADFGRPGAAFSSLVISAS